MYLESRNPRCCTPKCIQGRNDSPFSRLLFLIWIGLAALATPLAAWGQAMDRLDVIRTGDQAEIHIRFVGQVRYLRHAPQAEGKDLRIFVELVASDFRESDLSPEHRKSPTTDLVPPFTLVFPDLTNTILISFQKTVRYSVRQGVDSRSIVVTVPAMPGAKDWSAEQRWPDERSRSSAQAKDVAGETPLAAAQPPAPRIDKAKADGLQPAPQPEAIASAPLPAATEAAKPSTPVADPAAAAIPPQTAPPVSDPAKFVDPAEIERQAKALMREAQQALGNRIGTQATAKLNQILNLPPNSLSRHAQALVGQGREMSGELGRAKAEYELYLKLYPDGEDVASVKERLAALETRIRQTRGEARKARGVPPSGWIVNGGISQYYYTGKSQIEVITPPPPGQLTFTTDNLSLVDQKALISTIDVLARKRDEVTDTRMVFRDAHTMNFLPGQKNRERLNAAYFEQTNKEAGTFFRVGRQTASSGGIFNRFDGVIGGYNFDPEWKINAAFGYPVEYGSPYERKFYSVSAERAPQLEKPGFSTYYMEQTVDGVPDRRAVGLDVRYFDSYTNYYGLLDYDLAFRGINILMTQGNWRFDSGTNVFAYYDYRKSPPYSPINAMSGESPQSISELNRSLGLDELRRRAAALTTESNMFSIGATHPVTERWQLGADYRLAAIGGTDASGTMPAQPGSGTSHVYSAQAIGNNLWLSNDIVVTTGSLIRAPTYKGKSYGLTYAFTLLDNWRIDGNLRYYAQVDTLEQQQNRISPSLKVGYRWKDSVSFELEFGGEYVDENGPQRTMTSTRQYLWGGYRWDFR
jgi:hypothetical protein